MIPIVNFIYYIIIKFFLQMSSMDTETIATLAVVAIAGKKNI